MALPFMIFDMEANMKIAIYLAMTLPSIAMAYDNGPGIEPGGNSSEATWLAFLTVCAIAGWLALRKR